MEQPTKYVGPKSTIAKARGAVLAPMPLARREQCALELSIYPTVFCLQSHSTDNTRDDILTLYTKNLS